MRRRWISWLGVLILILLYLGIWAVGSLQITAATDFDAFFLPAAKIALSGHPFEIYRLRYQGLYPNANGPLSTLPLTLVALLAEKLGILNDFVRCRMLVSVVFAVFPLLLSREAVLSVDMLHKTRLSGWRRVLAYAVFALSPELWHSVLGYGHIEHPLMLFLMVAGVRSLMLRRTAWGGVLLGLALLTRSSAILYLMPLTLLLLAQRDWWGALRFAGCALATVALGLLPFAVLDRSDLIYSLVTFHGLLPLGGGSIWGVVSSTPLATIGNHYDTLFVIGASLLLSLFLLVRFRNLRLGSPDVYALLAVSGLCFPLLLKTLWPYYYLDSYMLLALWWLASARWLAERGGRIRSLLGVGLPLLAVLAGELSEYGLSSSGGSWTAGWSLAMMILTLSMMMLVIGMLWYRSRGEAERRPQGEAVSLVGTSAQLLIQ